MSRLKKENPRKHADLVLHSSVINRSFLNGPLSASSDQNCQIYRAAVVAHTGFAGPRSEELTDVRCRCGFPKTLGSHTNADVLRHILGCATSGGATRRHNMLRDAVGGVLVRAGYQVKFEHEVEGVQTADGHKLRVDILAYPPGNGAPLLFDFTVYNSAAKTQEDKDVMEGLAKRDAAKLKKYHEAAVSLGGEVRPFAIGVFGQMQRHTITFLQGLVKDIKARSPADEAVSYSTTVIPALSRALVLGNGICLLFSGRLEAFGVDVSGRRSGFVEELPDDGDDEARVV